MQNFAIALIAIGITACTAKKAELNSPEQLKEISIATVTPERPRLNIEIQNFCPNQYEAGSNLVLDDFFVRNLSAHITPQQILGDFDRDGIPDTIESSSIGEAFGVLPQFADSSDGGTGDGYHDLVVYRAGFELKAQSKLKQQTCSTAKCTQSGKCDENGYYSEQAAPYSADRLNYCEKEIVLGINPEKSDNSNVGIPDYFKVLSGINPSDPAELYLKTAGDSLTNLDKVRLGIPVQSAVNDFIKSNMPSYKTLKMAGPLPKTTPSCNKPFELHADNIVLGPTSNYNLVLTYLGLKTDKGERRFQICCSLVEQKKTGTRTLTVDWSKPKDDIYKMQCPCPNRVEDVEGGGA